MCVDYPNSIIVRHNRENLKKCTLSGIENRSDCRFLLYPDCLQYGDFFENLTRYVLLDFEGPELSLKDADAGIVLLDGTWRYTARMMKNIPGLHKLPRRSLPKGLQTAYPRRQPDCTLPERGLASIEALFSAYSLLGRDASGLLDHYFWKESFISNNSNLITNITSKIEIDFN